MKSNHKGAVRGRVVLALAGVALFLIVGVFLPLLWPAPSLVGGTRLNYVMDFEEALADGRLSQHELDDTPELMRVTVEILEHRLDPRFGSGPRGARVSAVDSNQFAVELPPSADEEGMARVRSIIESAATLEFFLGAEVDSQRFDLAAERERVLSWIEQNPGVSLVRYNALAPEEGGAPAVLRWFPHHVSSHVELGANPPLEQRLVPLVVLEERFHFQSEDLQRVSVSTDAVGLPAVFVELTDSRKAAFSRLTREHVGDALAIVFDDEVLVLATINEELGGSCIINGGARGFRIEEVNRLVNLLRGGSLVATPELVSEELITESLPSEDATTDR